MNGEFACCLSFKFPLSSEEKNAPAGLQGDGEVALMGTTRWRRRV